MREITEFRDEGAVAHFHPGQLRAWDLYKEKVVLTFAPPLFSGKTRKDRSQARPALRAPSVEVLARVNPFQPNKLFLDDASCGIASRNNLPPVQANKLFKDDASYEIRTRVLALKGPRPSPLDEGGNSNAIIAGFF